MEYVYLFVIAAVSTLAPVRSGGIGGAAVWRFGVTTGCWLREGESDSARWFVAMAVAEEGSEWRYP